MTIDILCKIVDNYGDIGVAYRLAKSLAAAAPLARLRLSVDDLGSFKALEPAIDANLSVQSLRGWEIVRWDSPASAYATDSPTLVIECFASGRPEGLESLLFDPTRDELRHVINLEHLSAEAWVEDFHKLPSLTRSSEVKKHFFMPGFTVRTGALIMDPAFIAALARARAAADRRRMRAELAPRLGIDPHSYEESFALVVFSYEHNYSALVGDLATWEASRRADARRDSDAESEGGSAGRLRLERRLIALVAAGRGQASFIAAWEGAGRPYPAIALPFLPQETWDEVILSADFLIVRGEESLARAVLSGRPFIWHAYLQENNHQLVKLRALLDLMRGYFAEPGASAAFELYEGLSIAFNDRLADSPAAGGKEELLPLLAALPELEAGFHDFASAVFALGDLGEHLVTFIREIV